MKSKPLPENSIERKLVAPSAAKAASSAAFAFWARTRPGHSIVIRAVISTVLFIIALFRGSILSRSKRCADEKNTPRCHAGPALYGSAKRAGLDGKHRSDTPDRANDSGNGAVANQRPEVCGKPPHEKLFSEGRSGRTERAGP